MKRISVILTLLMILVASNLIFGQEIELKMYTVEDGLPYKVVRNISQDKFGHIWIGTEYGLGRYDGHSITSYYHNPQDSNSISNNAVFGLDTDKQGYIWIGTNNGLNLYDPFKNRFYPFIHSNSINSLSNNHVRVVFVDSQDNVWIGTEDGLNLFNRQDSSFVRFHDDREFQDEFGKKNLSYNRVNSIIEDDYGQIWIGLDGGGIKIYNLESGRFKLIEIPSKNKNTQLNIVRNILPGLDGFLWIGTDAGLVKYDLITEKFKTYLPSDEKGGLNYNYIWSILESSADELWLGSYGGGLIVFDRKTERFSSYRQIAKRSNRYEDNLLWTLFKDRDNNVWVGFDGNGGVGFYDNEAFKFERLLSSNNKSDRWNVTNIIEINQDSLLVDTQKGRFIYDKEKEMHPLILAGEQDESWGISLKTRNGYFFTIPNALIFTDESFNKKIKITLKSKMNYTTAIEDTKGIIWLGTLDQGLMKINPMTEEIEEFFHEGNSKIYTDSRSISALYLESDSIIWVASIRSGILKFNTITHEQKRFLYRGNDLFEPTINSIAKGKGNSLWLGTQEDGLVKFDMTTSEITLVKGLQRDQIKSILVDSLDGLWITSNKGIKYYNEQNDSIVVFGEEDGLQSQIFNNANAKGLSGNLYFGGENGINRFMPEEIEIDHRTSPILLEGIQVNGEVFELSDSKMNFHELSELNLTHDQNDISIDFSVNNYIHSENIKFQYKVNNNSWRELGTQHAFLLSNLAPGNYQLAIRSINHDGVYGSSRDLIVNISPPWWLEWWVITLGSIFIFAIIAYFVFARLNRTEKQKLVLEQLVYERTLELETSKSKIEKALEERESLLKEIHHRVKNNLQIIANLLYLQSSKSDDEKMKDILEEGQGRVRSMALIHQKLYENDDIKSIPFGEYIMELVNEIKSSFGREGANININVDAKDISFDVDNAVPLGLIINELTTNAFKYAFEDKSKGSFNVFMQKEEDGYSLHISDDGRGIPEEIDIRKTRSLGLRLVRILSEQLEGEYSFENNNGMNFKLKFAA